MAAASGRSSSFFNYPEPLKGPDVPYRPEHRWNPAIRGFLLVPAAFLMEWLRFVREIVWHNTGFASLRKIRQHIENYEPWFEPTVVPRPPAKLIDVDGPDDDDHPAPDDPVPAPPADRRTPFPHARYYSVDDYHQMYLSGELTPTDVAQALLPLIRRDTVPPGAHSAAWFQTRVDLVLRAAAASTARYREKRPLGPLDGVPTAVKDEYDVEGYRSCLGSRNDYTGDAREDGRITTWCVRAVEAAGAVNLGKLSMHEFGLDTTGNNPVYGTPRNPHNPRYYTGGSSSGPGYAVAAGLVPVVLGSDGGGSIRIPASMCGLFGLKPTSGRLSFRPGQNHCLTCAVLGPMAADVRSLAALFQAMARPHPSSPFPPLAPLRLRHPPLRRARLLGVPEAWFDRAAPAVRTLCRDLVRRLVDDYGYATVPVEIPLLPEGQIAHALCVLTDAATLLPDTRNLTPANRILIALGTVTPASDYLLAQKLRRLLMQHLAHLWRAHPNLLIVTPTTGCAGWPIRSEAELRYGVSDGDRTMQTMEYTWLANFCGVPALTVPAGFVVPEGSPGAGAIAGADVAGKIPVGLMATGEWCAEELLLQFGADAEQAGADLRDRPPIWVDVLEAARQVHQDAAGGGGGGGLPEEQ